MVPTLCEKSGYPKNTSLLFFEVCTIVMFVIFKVIFDSVMNFLTEQLIVLHKMLYSL